MRNIFFIGISLFVIMLSACRSHRQVVRQTSSDSTAVTFREVEKIIHVAGDTVVLVMPVKVQSPCPETLIFIPQSQTIETKRSKVHLEITKTGEIKAEAVCKELEEKVTLLEKTITNYKSEITEYQVKESFLVKAKATVWRWIKVFCFCFLIGTAIYAVIKLGFNPFSIVKKLFKKS